MFKIGYRKKAFKQLEKLPNSIRENIAQRIHNLANNQESADIKQFSRTRNSWRLRVGKIRIIYQVDSESKTIRVKNIGYRGDIYKHSN